MWLRDHLPSEVPRSRIMTFAYNSNLTDGKSINHGLKDFADSLIDALKYVRASDDEQRRPILLICHSMGGLSVKFGQYGLLFLSTPHSGADMANFSDLALDFAFLVAGVRKSLVEELKTFNPSIQEVIDDWKTMKPPHVIRYLHETNLTKTSVRNKQIVTSISAGFIDTAAGPVSATDHRSICRFETKFDKGWAKVPDTVKEIRRELLGRSVEAVEHAPNVHELPQELKYPDSVLSKSNSL
ncbi:hypothetical protein FZEAL_1199 [Fusarium zealandicum]|uniref:GPI inositol-deacylase n=1 Tax=Fusarium zealandicum TaxID=1053134 RepID=A0A8H4UTD6_9HYPO|nr:hypothetical protein FZEAL_1199 [Fusarium zealandicum]